MTLYHALKTLQERHPDASITKSTVMFKAKGGMSGGTINSMRSVAGLKAEERKDGEWCLTPCTFCPDISCTRLFPVLESTLQFMIMAETSWIIHRIAVCIDIHRGHGV
jgi:hypothetical protein